ncbi:unnamed protein product [marine sediment metagenome]|uniref:Uncharacterized protein n=1 Tax=marine sediment metagenome TaxID=412755 RepID=X1IZ41_9ZZZZ
MKEGEAVTTVKKTVVLHPIMDTYVRKTWAILIEDGHDATYSMALNFMLLATIMLAKNEEGLSEETQETLQGFLSDQQTINHLNSQEYLSRLRGIWGLGD